MEGKEGGEKVLSAGSKKPPFTCCQDLPIIVAVVCSIACAFRELCVRERDTESYHPLSNESQESLKKGVFDVNLIHSDSDN